MGGRVGRRSVYWAWPRDLSYEPVTTGFLPVFTGLKPVGNRLAPSFRCPHERRGRIDRFAPVGRGGRHKCGSWLPLSGGRVYSPSSPMAWAGKGSAAPYWRLPAEGVSAQLPNRNRGPWSFRG